MNGRFLWVPTLLFGVPSLLAAAGAYWFDILLVDMIPLPLSVDGESVARDAAIMLLTFVFLLVCIRAGAMHVGARVFKSAPRLVGPVIFVLQMITLASTVFFDYGRVGAEVTSINALATLASYLKSDLLFLIYYSHQRPNRMPIWNLLAYLIGNVVRGWSSAWLIVFLIEIYYLLEGSKRSLGAKTLLVLTLAGLIAFPLLNYLKESVRGVDVESLSYVESYVRLFNRLQHATNVVLIDQESRNIAADYEAGHIAPWYANGVLSSRLGLYSPSADSLQKYITQRYLIDLSARDPGADEQAWYSHVGIAGWLFVLPWYELPFYLLYVAFLIMLPYWLVGRFIHARSTLPVMHVASFLYVLHGWLEVQFAFVVAVAAYAGLVNVLNGGRYPASAGREPQPGLLR